MSSYPVLCGEEVKETPQAKRLRLASELRFLTQQLNSKTAELLEAGLTVNVHTRAEVLVDEESLIGNVEVSYQTPRKFY